MIMGFTYEYTYQDHEYTIRTMNTMQLSTPGIHSACNQTLYMWFSWSRQCNCTLSFWAHLWSSCLGNASQLYANTSYLNTAWRPCEARWQFSRTTLLRDFTAKPTHSTAVFALWVYIFQPASPCLTLSAHTEPNDIAGSGITNCLTHTCYSWITG